MIQNYENKTAWWEGEDERQRATLLYDYTKGIAEDQTNYQRYYDLRHARLYSNRYYTQLRGVTYGIKKDDNANRGSYSLRLNRNIVKSAIDSVTAKITKRPVRPRFLTDGGDSVAQSKAEKANKYVQGLFYQVGMHAKSTEVFKDCAIFGTGFLKHYFEKVPGQKDKYRIRCRRTMPDQIVVDPADAYYKEPRSLMEVSFPSKKALMQIYPDKKDEILAAKAEESFSSQGYHQEYLQVVMVVEGWSLETAEGKGRHVITVGGVSILDEEWPFDFFPFTVMRYSEPLYGYFGTGIAEELTGLQIEINRLMISIQKSMYLLARPKVFYQKGSINTRLYNNEEGGFVPYQGNIPPTVVSPSAVPQGAFNQIQTYEQMAFRQVGISELSASSTIPAQLKSGRAIVEARDSETERFSQTVHAFEQFTLESADIMLKMVRYLGEQGHDYQVSSFDRQQGMEVLSWNDIKLDPNGYVMQCFPTSALPDSPEGRLELIETMAQSGLFEPDRIRPLLDYPDLDEDEKLNAAGLKNLKKNLDKIMMGEEADLPEPSTNLALAKKLVAQYKDLAGYKDYDDTVLAALDQYEGFVDFLLAKAATPPAPPPMEQAPPPDMETTPPAGEIPPELIEQATAAGAV